MTPLPIGKFGVVEIDTGRCERDDVEDGECAPAKRRPAFPAESRHVDVLLGAAPDSCAATGARPSLVAVPLAVPPTHGLSRFRQTATAHRWRRSGDLHSPGRGSSAAIATRA